MKKKENYTAKKNVRYLLQLLGTFAVALFCLGWLDLDYSTANNSTRNVCQLNNTSKYMESDSLAGTKYLDLDCVRPKGNRKFPYPISGQGLLTNPPVFLWPMNDYEFPSTFPSTYAYKSLSQFDTYYLQLSQDDTFSSKATIVAKNLLLPMYHPHSKLENGVWFWRYSVEGRDSIDWSETYSFVIDESLPVFESPTPKSAISSLLDEHPRISRTPQKKKLTSDQKGLINDILTKGKEALKKELNDFVVKGEEIPKDESKQKIAQIERFRLKYEIGSKTEAIESLLLTYEISKNQSYLDKAKLFVNSLLKLNPEQTYKKSDFAAAQAMSTMAHIYDVGHEILSVSEKKKYENFINKVAEQMVSTFMQGNVGSADGILQAHFFQHTYFDLLQTSLIMRGHIEKAEIWIQMLYDIWLVRTPGGGTIDDGAWPNGNIGYIHTNMEAWVKNYLLFEDFFGVNTFKHPWYENCASALAYLTPPNSCGDGFGDGLENTVGVNAKRAGFAYILGQETNNPFAVQYAYALNGQGMSEVFEFSKKSFKEYRFRHEKNKYVKNSTKEMPQSMQFPQTGIVTMHTDLMNSNKNLFVSFRSSPFGVGSHGHADQNSFNIIYKGRPIFYPTGYRITTQDKHYLLGQKHTRAKNSILVDGKAQSYDHNSYGWIARYLSGTKISYALGDASQAYRKFDPSSVNWITVLQNINAYNPENGFIVEQKDDPRLTLYRRHLVFLRPSTIVVYDELEAEEPITWTFQLNGRKESNLSLRENGTTLESNTALAKSVANVYGSQKLKYHLRDEYLVKPFDWLNPQRGRRARKFEDKQFWFTAENVQKTKKMRFFSIIEIDVKGETKHLVSKAYKNGIISVDGYEINVELDTQKPARLDIKDTGSKAHLLYGPDLNNSFEGRRFTNSTLYYEYGKELQEVVDTLPIMVPD